MQEEPKSKTQPDPYDLWKYFSDDAAKVKDKLWTIAIWLFALKGSVLGYISKQLDVETMLFNNPVFIGVIALLGVVLSGYTYNMITSYGEHIRTAWNRTDYLKRQIDYLDEVWKQGYANYSSLKQNKDKKTQEPYVKSDAIPSFVKRIRWISVGFAMVFVLIILFLIKTV